MRCGVRFCGGCNPRYDRNKAYHEIVKKRPEIDFDIAEEGKEYDFLLVIGGCTNCCASHCQFSTKNGVSKMWSDDHVDKVIAEIDSANYVSQKNDDRK